MNRLHGYLQLQVHHKHGVFVARWRQLRYSAAEKGCVGLLFRLSLLLGRIAVVGAYALPRDTVKTKTKRCPEAHNN